MKKIDRKHDIVLRFLKSSPRKPENWQAVLGIRNKRKWKGMAFIKRLKKFKHLQTNNTVYENIHNAKYRSI